jgi:hypothetical protein
MKIPFFYCGPTGMPTSGALPNPPKILLTDTGPTIAMSECLCKGKKGKEVGRGERRLVATSKQKQSISPPDIGRKSETHKGKAEI